MLTPMRGRARSPTVLLVYSCRVRTTERTAGRPLMTNQDRAEIGIFGGSGFYSFLDDARDVHVETPYGEPSAPLTVGSVGGRSVAFLPRHGRAHQYPPHMINCRANVGAMRELGVTRIIGPCAAGADDARDAAPSSPRRWPGS